jgi:predicted tellurium resistance membrane protein TerC
MDYQIIISLVTLVVLEIVLGIDNVVFISIIAGKLPIHQQKKARLIGLLLAMVLRLVLLALISVILHLHNELFRLYDQSFSGKDLILIGGGMFLIYKSTKEIFHRTEGVPENPNKKFKANSLFQVIVQILILDLVFSIDSILTAIGMVKELWVMYTAVIITVGIMMVAAGPISRFINRHPAFKVLALCFLLLIGFTLITEGLGIEIPKGYIYFAMAFSFGVDIIQMKLNKGKESPESKDEIPEGSKGKRPPVNL